MGMSGDFEIAVEEGATLVRVGTALFGPRAKAKPRLKKTEWGMISQLAAGVERRSVESTGGPPGLGALRLETNRAPLNKDLA